MSWMTSSEEGGAATLSSVIRLSSFVTRIPSLNVAPGEHVAVRRVLGGERRDPSALATSSSRCHPCSSRCQPCP